MDPLTSTTLVMLRQHELRVDAARGRLAAEARRARRQRSSPGWLRRVAIRRPRYSRAPSLPSVLADSDFTHVARRRAFGRIADELTTPTPESVQHRSGTSDAA